MKCPKPLTIKDDVTADKFIKVLGVSGGSTMTNGVMKHIAEQELPLPYIGELVAVIYNNEYTVGKITRILDEKIVKYRVAKCGSRKYTESQLERVK